MRWVGMKSGQPYALLGVLGCWKVADQGSALPASLTNPRSIFHG